MLIETLKAILLIQRKLVEICDCVNFHFIKKFLSSKSCNKEIYIYIFGTGLERNFRVKDLMNYDQCDEI